MEPTINPDKLREIATFMDQAFPDDKNPVMQAYLRYTADQAIALQEQVANHDREMNKMQTAYAILKQDAARAVKTWDRWSALPLFRWFRNRPHKLDPSELAQLSANMDRLAHAIEEHA